MGLRGARLTLDRDLFGPVLRAGRERRKVTLEQLSKETNVAPEVWMALEANDFSRWPTRIYARSLIRQYAERVDLDPEALVNEFCRLFPHGDRRIDPVIREHAAIVGHATEYGDEWAAHPGRRRRVSEHLAAGSPAGYAMLAADTLVTAVTACAEWLRTWTPDWLPRETTPAWLFIREPARLK